MTMPAWQLTWASGHGSALWKLGVRAESSGMRSCGKTTHDIVACLVRLYVCPGKNLLGSCLHSQSAQGLQQGPRTILSDYTATRLCWIAFSALDSILYPRTLFIVYTVRPEARRGQPSVGRYGAFQTCLCP